MLDCNEKHGGYGFMLMAIFLIILFALWGRGHGGNVWGGNDCAHGVGPADFWAANGLAQAVPGFQAQNFTQQAINFGALTSTVKEGNWALSQQITDSEKNALRDQLFEARARLLQQETINTLASQRCADQAAIMAEFCNIKSNMLTKPPVQSIVGLPHVQCTNLPFGVGSPCCA